MAPLREVTIGVPLYEWQALDVVGPIDILNTQSYQWLSMLFGEEKATYINAPKVTFHYISSDSNQEPQQTSGSIAVQPTATYSSCPKLDYLLLGGPTTDFAANLPEDLKAFIRAKAAEVSVILTTCTGALVLAATGLLDGVHATVNHRAVPFAEKQFPAVKWDNGPNWVISEVSQDQQIWTAAGAGAGMDMMAEFCRVKFGNEGMDYTTTLLEWQPRDIKGTGVRFVNGRGEVVPASEIVAN